MDVDMKFMRDSVIEATSNDYENIGTFAAEIEGWALTDGKEYSYVGLIQALEELTQEGLVFAYRYEAKRSEFIASKFSRDDIDELWFYASK